MYKMFVVVAKNGCVTKFVLDKLMKDGLGSYVEVLLLCFGPVTFPNPIWSSLVHEFMTK